MPATAASRLTPYAQGLLDNEYAQENLLNGAAKLRDAYKRSKKAGSRPPAIASFVAS